MSSGWLEGVGHLFSHLVEEISQSSQQKKEELYRQKNKLAELSEKVQESFTDYDTFYDLGRYEQALDSIDEAILLMPKLQNLLEEIGVEVRFQKQIGASYSARAIVLYKLNRYEESIKALHKAFTLAPELELETDDFLKILKKRLNM